MNNAQAMDVSHAFQYLTEQVPYLGCVLVKISGNEVTKRLVKSQKEPQRAAGSIRNEQRTRFSQYSIEI